MLIQLMLKLLLKQLQALTMFPLLSLAMLTSSKNMDLKKMLLSFSKRYGYYIFFVMKFFMNCYAIFVDKFTIYFILKAGIIVRNLFIIEKSKQFDIFISLLQLKWIVVKTHLITQLLLLKSMCPTFFYLCYISGLVFLLWRWFYISIFKYCTNISGDHCLDSESTI